MRALAVNHEELKHVFWVKFRVAIHCPLMQMSKTVNCHEIFIDRDPQLLIDRAPLWFFVVAIRKLRIDEHKPYQYC